MKAEASQDNTVGAENKVNWAEHVTVERSRYYPDTVEKNSESCDN